MNVIGYNEKADFVQAPRVIAKHTGKSLAEATKICSDLQKGLVARFDNDFVLREDLEELGFYLD